MIRTILLTIELTATLCSLIGCAVKKPEATIAPLVEPLEVRSQLPATDSCPCRPVCSCPLCVCEVQKKPDEVAVEKEPTLYFELHTSIHCAECERWKTTVLPVLKRGGWKEGQKGHVRLVEYGKTGWPGSLPQFRFFRGGKEFARRSIYLDEWEIAREFERKQTSGRVSQRSQQVSTVSRFVSPRYVIWSTCGPGGCR